jgi:4-diphosphocytidyl-2-C-methyl-D-erythritol kinase
MRAQRAVAPRRTSSPALHETAALTSTTAPAKINLVLEVAGRRPDGFHELRSVLAPLALTDTLSVGLARFLPAADGWTVRGADRLAIAGAPGLTVEENLVLRAAALLRAGTARPLPPLAFRLRKRIPVAAGLGGGSSDALAALDLAASAWGLRLGERRRLRLAALLGSDVPFFALGGWALAGGRGERLRRLPPPAGGPLGVLLVVPAARLSTRDVFAALDAAGAGGTREGRAGPAGVRGASVAPPLARPSARLVAPPGAGHGDAARLADLLRRGARALDVAAIAPANDLLPAAARLLPDLEPLRRGLSALLGRAVHLSGSGPSLAVLYPSPWGARRAASLVRAAARDGHLPQPGGSLEVIATRTLGGEA